MTADYCLIPRGLLTWVDIEKMRAEALPNDSTAMWWNFNSLYKPGDCIADYRTHSDRGYLLIRRDRLVWEVEAIHMNVLWVFLKFSVEVAHFEGLGGTRGFLNGDFAWPDPNWIYPISDEEEQATILNVARTHGPQWVRIKDDGGPTRRAYCLPGGRAHAAAVHAAMCVHRPGEDIDRGGC